MAQIPDPDDDRFEQLLATALRESSAAAPDEGGPPSSAIVWWRSQMRAKQEAVRAAERPIAIVHAVSIACVAGLTLSLIGLALAWARAAGMSLDLAQLVSTSRSAAAASVLAGGWVLPVAGSALAVLVASIAAAVLVTHD